MSHPFRTAVEARDMDGVVAALAPDVVFRSPIVFRPYHGKEPVGRLLRLVAEIFDEFEYVDELHGEGTLALVFHARAGNREVEGLDYLRLGNDDLVEELMVMVRPLSAAITLGEAMRAKLEASPIPEIPGG